jgi:hypothetical protein
MRLSALRTSARPSELDTVAVDRWPESPRITLFSMATIGANFWRSTALSYTLTRMLDLMVTLRDLWIR